MSRMLTRTLVTLALSATIAGPALASAQAAPAAVQPAPAAQPIAGMSGSSAIDTGSGILQSGSAAVVNPLYALLCATVTGSSICHLGDL